MMKLDAILRSLSFVFASVAILAGPWLFGAWEMWWFWPFVLCIFAAMFFFGLRLVTGSYVAATAGIKRSRLVWFGVFVCLPFLAYAFLRTLQAEVFMDAERNFLLFLTPFLLFILIAFGSTHTQLKLLYMLVLVDLLLLGLYGIINDHLTNSSKVLWVTTEYVQYAGRATGSYFCPDHFSGVMELLFAMALGIMLARNACGLSRPGRLGMWSWRILALLLIVVSIRGVWLSSSRGGGLTIIVTMLFATACGISYGRAPVRWLLRLGMLIVLVAGSTLAWQFDAGYISRFKGYFGWKNIRGRPLNEAKHLVLEKLKTTPRYNMYSAALRAWQTSRWVGIGPGMHQHLWPHFAASPDGDRQKGKRPSRTNRNYHSYEVHSDWVQLLEEHGLVGLILLLVPAGVLLAVLVGAIRRRIAHPIALGGTLALVAMMFHSLGDFNLQMPATTWLLAAIVSIAFTRSAVAFRQAECK